MSLYIRNKTWWIYLITQTGAKIRRSTHTDDKKEAQKVHDLLKAKLIQSPRFFIKGQATLTDAVERWYEEASHKATFERDKQILAFFCQSLGNIKLCDLTAEHIRLVLREKKCKRGTINCYLATIKAVLRRAERVWEMVEHAPSISLLPDVERRIRYLTKDEARNLLSELPLHLKEMALFSLSTGLRASNVTGLAWSQVDLKRNHLWIHPDQAKAKKAIAVPLNHSAREVIERQMGKHESFVFTFRGKPVATRPNNHAWRKALKRAGIKNFKWHDLRHTWASWHIQAGTPLHVLQELGGWSSYEMVRRYAHLSSDHLHAYSQRIETQDLLGKI
jgi:integrase